MHTLQDHLVRLLRWSERYTKTDMVYLASGGIWLTLQQVIMALFALALAVAFGHFASQDTYGNYKYALALAGILGAFSLTGIGTAVTQATARGFEGSLTHGFKTIIRWSPPMVLLGLVGALYYYAQGNLFAAGALVVISILSPFHIALSLFSSFLIGKHDFKRTALYSIVSSAVPTIALIAALLLLPERAIYLVVVYFIITVVTHAYCFAMSARLAANDATDPHLVRYGSHLSVMGFIATIADRIDSIIVFTLLGPIELAVYTYAMAIPEQIKGLFKNIGTLSMAKFAVRPLRDIKRTIWLRLTFLALVLTFIIAAYIFFAPLIFAVFFPVYVDAVEYSRIYAISIICTAFIYPVTAILQSHKRTKELYVATNASSILLIVLLGGLTYQFGIMGAIVAQVLYRITNALISAWQLYSARNES